MNCCNRPQRIPGNFFRKSGKCLTMLLLALLGAWCVGVSCFVWHFSGAVSVLFGCVLLVIWLSAWSVCRAVWMLAFAELCVLFSFLLLTPAQRFRNEKWNVECRKVPMVSRLADGRIAIGNIRDFHYRSVEDFDVRYRDDVFDPAQLSSMDIAFSYWLPCEAAAHTLLQFNFSDGKKLAVSFEPRVPQGFKGGSFWLGVYRQYGQMMLFASPEDIFGVRVNHRKEDFYLYRTTISGKQLKNIFCNIVRQAEALSHRDEFYNSLTRNCTTGLAAAFREVPELHQFDLRWILNGYCDRLLFEKGVLETTENERFASLKARSLCRRQI